MDIREKILNPDFVIIRKATKEENEKLSKGITVTINRYKD